MTHHHKAVGVTLHGSHAAFRLWAPFANEVAVTGTFNNWGNTPLEPEGDGYWFVRIRGAQAGQEYKYVINGDTQKNDPRALQLTTTAGNSVLVDLSHDWQGDDFHLPPIEEQVLYELHIGTFYREDPSTEGTFETACKKLDYLAELGITTIELMPVASMAMDRGWGYAPDYPYAVESLYGGRAGLLEFVRAAHQRGMGVVLDVVYNHFGPDEDCDLWRFDGWSEQSAGGIYFYNDWRAETPWGRNRPDYGRPEVRQYILDNVRLWLQAYHLDGLRVDSTIYMRNVLGRNNDPDNDIPEAWGLLQDISRLGHKLKPGALMVAEDSSGNDYIVKPSRDGGAGFDAQWEVGFPGILRQLLDAVHDDDRQLDSLCTVLAQRYAGDAFRRIIYSDSHDSAANGSSRLNEEISPGRPASLYARRRSLLAMAVVLTGPGIPMLLQGQEFLQGGSFNDWQALDWARAGDRAGLIAAHRHLLALRRNRYGHSRGLTGQGFDLLERNDADKLLAYARWHQDIATDGVVVVINFANTSQKNYTLGFPADGSWIVRFNSDWRGYSEDFGDFGSTTVEVQDKKGTVAIAPYSVLILSREP